MTKAVYIRLCLEEVLFGQLDLQTWQTEIRQILAALVVDCRGVYDAIGRSFFALGLKGHQNFAWKRWLSNRVLLIVVR